MTQFNGCDLPSPQTEAPATAYPIQATATVAVELELDGPASNAVYLFVKDDSEWCPAAELLEPIWQHGGYCESAIDLRWLDPAATPPGGMAIQAERACHMPLDTEELEAGVSDVAVRECVEVRYVLTGGSIRQLSRARSDNACTLRWGERP